MTSFRRNSCLPATTEATVAHISAAPRRLSIRPHIHYQPWDRACHGASILWSFAASDIKTMVLPVTAFGVLSALGSNALFQTHVPLANILARTPLLLVWAWLNLLLHTISNQRSPEGIAEDLINKPWRPIPAGLITAEQARHLSLGIAPIVGLVGLALGVEQETFWAVAGSWYYCDLGGADTSWQLRQALNGIGYSAYGAGAVRILTGVSGILPPTVAAWLVLVGIIVATTIQVQDLKDEEGDRLRDRKTIPIVLGMRTARLSVAIGVMTWSLLCPLWWQVGMVGAAGPLGLGVVVAWRAVSKRSREADKTTFVAWGLWIMTLFALPAFQTHGL